MTRDEVNKLMGHLFKWVFNFTFNGGIHMFPAVTAAFCRAPPKYVFKNQPKSIENDWTSIRR
jgi:hypothetical protein